MNPFMTRDPSATGSFLPDEYIAERHDARANLLTITLFAITLAAVLTAFFVTNRHWTALREQEAAINLEYQTESVKIEQLKSLEQQRTAILMKAEIAAELVEKLPRWAVLGELTLRMPASVRLSMCDIKSERSMPTDPGVNKAMANLVAQAEKAAGQKSDVTPAPVVPVPTFRYKLSLEGTAATNNDVADYLAGLKLSPALTGVELTFIRDATSLGEPLRQFQITANLSASGDTEALAASLRQLIREREESAPATRKGLLHWLTGSGNDVSKAPESPFDAGKIAMPPAVKEEPR
ncbi:MAG: PilN domain-containing protein [Phycisphaerae bacterium]